MPIVIVFAVILAAAEADPPPAVLLYSSQAIDIAKAAAVEWNRGPLPRGTAFDVVDTDTDKRPGYSTVIYYVGDRPRLEISINLKTGQIVEPNRCLLFTGPKIRAFSSLVRQKTGARLVPPDVLANEIGCDVLKPA